MEYGGNAKVSQAIDWPTPTQSLRTVFRWANMCTVCKRGFITKWSGEIRDHGHTSHIVGEYCSNAMCKHNVRTTHGKYF